MKATLTTRTLTKDTHLTNHFSAPMTDYNRGNFVGEWTDSIKALEGETLEMFVEEFEDGRLYFTVFKEVESHGGSKVQFYSNTCMKRDGKVYRNTGGDNIWEKIKEFRKFLKNNS